MFKERLDEIVLVIQYVNDKDFDQEPIILFIIVNIINKDWKRYYSYWTPASKLGINKYYWI